MNSSDHEAQHSYGVYTNEGDYEFVVFETREDAEKEFEAYIARTEWDVEKGFIDEEEGREFIENVFIFKLNMNKQLRNTKKSAIRGLEHSENQISVERQVEALVSRMENPAVRARVFEILQRGR